LNHSDTFLNRLLRRVALVEPGESAAVLVAMLYFFLLFAGYFMLRPVRETMAITGGVRNLQWLFTATFVAMLVAAPVFGALAARFARRVLVPWVSVFFLLNLLAFALLFMLYPGHVWIARVFYVWLSVFNLFVISVAWSVMVDVFDSAQARRLFPPIAAGASAGGLAGPALGALLVEPLGHGGLMALSSVLLLLTVFCIRYLFAWRAAHPVERHGSAVAPGENAGKALGGNPLAGLLLVLKSPYLLGISVFVLLLATTTTFLYFDQARLVAESFPDPARQTQVFGMIDFVVQALTIVLQLLATGRIARRFGITVLLVAVPLVVAGGFVVLAAAPVFAVLAVVMVVRRVGEYAVMRPAREMLFTAVDTESKYKAKNFIDTVVYRGGDAVSAWAKTGLDMLGHGPSFVALCGAVLAGIWAVVGLRLGRANRRLMEEGEAR
jgi:AAA family ATP:ADP antiporter